MTKDTTNAPQTLARFTTGERKHVQMFESPEGGGSWNVALTKAVAGAQRSNIAEHTGAVQHPFDWASAKRFKSADPHHSSCLEAKVNATVGLGFENESLPDSLDELCLVTWQDCVTALSEDFWAVGNAFLEVVRDAGGEIIALLHVAAENVHLAMEDARGLDFHYRILQARGSDTIAASFGDKDALIERRPAGSLVSASANYDEPESISEIIHIRRPSALHRWYGMPDWLAAVAQIELGQCITQFNYDFFLNNGVPEFIFMVMGADLGDTWDKEIVPALKSTTGMGNAHSTLAVNIPHKDVVPFIEKLGTEMGDGWFQEMLDTVAQRIVTAHRVPPIIAGIMIPGKLGANNEHVNAMWMFQGLVIGPAQEIFSSCLGRTLGGEDGVGGVSGKDAFQPKTIVDEIPTAQIEVAGSPNEPNKTVRGRQDIPGSSVNPSPQERQAAERSSSLSKRIAKAREALGDEVVDAIIEKQLIAVASALPKEE